MSIEQGNLNIVIPSDEASRKALNGALSEMVDSMTRVAAEKSLQKEIAAMVKEKYEIAPKVFNKWAKYEFKQDSDKELQEVDEIVSTFNLLKGRTD